MGAGPYGLAAHLAGLGASYVIFGPALKTFTDHALAAASFGPLMRFMYGVDFAARRVSQRLVRAA